MKKNNKKGFTLVELVIVVAVMAILVAVAIPTVASITSKATTAVEETNCRTIESVIKLYAATKANTNNAYVIDHDGAVAACAEAKLGIEKDTYYYVVGTGAVTHTKPGSGTDGTDYFTIGFAAGGAVSKNAYTAPTNS